MFFVFFFFFNSPCSGKSRFRLGPKRAQQKKKQEIRNIVTRHVPPDDPLWRETHHQPREYRFTTTAVFLGVELLRAWCVAHDKIGLVCVHRAIAFRTTNSLKLVIFFCLTFQFLRNETFIRIQPFFSLAVETGQKIRTIRINQVWRFENVKKKKI